MFTVEQIKAMIVSGDVKPFYKDRYWRSLALTIIAENHYECYLCKQQGKYTRAKLVHHVQHLKHHPELAYSRTYRDSTGEHIQLMPLCHDCHEKIHERSAGCVKPHEGFSNDEKW